jgi:Tfp pilus assembly protein PilW
VWALGRLVQSTLGVMPCAALFLLACGDRTGLGDDRLGSFAGSITGSTRGNPERIDAATAGAAAGTMTAASGTTAAAGTIASAGSNGNAVTCADTACGELCVLCGGDCVDEQIDTSNCGACGIACPEGTLCSRAACVCRPGYIGCLGQGGELALCLPETMVQDDPLQCGPCGTVCARGAVCQGGVCVNP